MICPKCKKKGKKILMKESGFKDYNRYYTCPECGYQEEDFNL